MIYCKSSDVHGNVPQNRRKLGQWSELLRYPVTDRQDKRIFGGTPMLDTILNVLLIVLAIAAVALVILYFLGRKMQKKQIEQQELMEAAAQTVSMLIIDKKKLRIKFSGLPKMVYEQTPFYLRWSKIPVVKAKIGPKVMTLMADAQVFEALPVKSEVRVVVSGIYISELKSVRGGNTPPAPKKKGFFARFKKK